MFKIIASDLDGTLLTPDHVLSPFTKKILQALKAQNIHFVFATGRHYIDVSAMRKEMEIDAFMITSNGARVHDQKNNLIFSQNIPTHLAKEIAQIAKDDPKVYTHIYSDEDWFINKEDPFSLKFYKTSNFQYKLFNPEDFDIPNIAKFYFTTLTDDEHEHLVAYKKTLEEKYGNQLHITFSTLNCLEVMDKNVSKGNALAQVAKLLNCTLKDCIAFGDGMNDVEMLSMAGKGCIMENASPELKLTLTDCEIIGVNTDDSVPHYLNKLFFDSKN